MQSVDLNLYYFSMSNGQPPRLIKVEADLTNRKMALISEQVYGMRGKANNDRERYIIETHEKEVEEVKKILKALK